MSAARYFLPGWGLGRGALQALADTLQAGIIDLPGYGNSPPTDDFDQAVEAVAASLPAGATLAGWSLGAELALAVAARHPDKVGKLVLIAGTASFVQRDGWPHAMPPETLAEFAAGIVADPDAMLPRFVGGFNRGDRRAKAVTLQLLKQAGTWPASAVLSNGLNWLRDVDLRPLAKRVKAPTLLLHGANDPLMPLAAAEALAKLIPQSELVVLADCAHAPFISQPEACAASLRAFIDA